MLWSFLKGYESTRGRITPHQAAILTLHSHLHSPCRRLAGFQVSTSVVLGNAQTLKGFALVALWIVFVFVIVVYSQCLVARELLRLPAAPLFS